MIVTPERPAKFELKAGNTLKLVGGAICAATVDRFDAENKWLESEPITAGLIATLGGYEQDCVFTINVTSGSVDYVIKKYALISHGSGPVADRPSAALFGTGTWQDGLKKYSCNGINWTEPSAQNLKTSSLAKTILSSFKAKIVAAGDAVTNYELDALIDPIDTLIRSSVWPKLKVLWIPLGTDATTGAMVPIIGANFTAVNMVSGDYSAALGVTGDAVSKYVNTNFNPTGNVTTTDWGYGAFAQNLTASGVLAGALTGTQSFITIAAGGSFMNSTSCNDTGSAKQYPGLQSVQCSGGFVNSWMGGFKQTQAAYVSGAVGNTALTLLQVNNGSFSNQSLCGFAAWSPALVESELTILDSFFRAANLALWRDKFKTNLVCCGDSNTVGTGTGVTTSNRWSKLLSTSLLLTEINKGVSGTSMSDDHNAVVSAGGDWVVNKKIINSAGQATSLLIVQLGTNDAQSAVPLADFSTDYEVWLNYQLSAGINPDQIILTSPVACTNALTDQSLLQQFRSVIASLSAKYGTGYFDAWLLTSTHTVDWFQTDLLHLNAAGHAGFSAGLLAYIGSSRNDYVVKNASW
ncbi:MAG: SGNH/GDSL hydrolase family protein [Methylococcaceae bacterium]